MPGLRKFTDCTYTTRSTKSSIVRHWHNSCLGIQQDCTTVWLHQAIKHLKKDCRKSACKTFTRWKQNWQLGTHCSFETHQLNAQQAAWSTSKDYRRAAAQSCLLDLRSCLPSIWSTGPLDQVMASFSSSGMVPWKPSVHFTHMAAMTCCKTHHFAWLSLSICTTEWSALQAKQIFTHSLAMHRYGASNTLTVSQRATWHSALMQSKMRCQLIQTPWEYTSNLIYVPETYANGFCRLQ